MSEITTDIYGVTEKNGIPVVDSLTIASIFNKEHKTVLRSIENCEASEQFNRHNFVPTSYKDIQNRKQKMYLLTKDGFAFIAMGFSGKKAAQFKEDYINCFNNMEQFIKTLHETKAEFPEFTEAIMEAHEEPKPYHYTNEIEMINRIVLGMSSKQFKDSNNLDKNVKSIRSYLSNDQVKEIRRLQKIDIGLIVSGMDFQQRKVILINKFNRVKQLSA